jgi:hypothetical protein
LVVVGYPYQGIESRCIYSPQRRKERKGLIIFRKSALLLFTVDPPKIPADSKDGKHKGQSASNARNYLCVTE